MKKKLILTHRALYWNLLGLWAILWLTLSLGLVIFTKYSDCDPILNKEVANAEQVKKSRNERWDFRLFLSIKFLLNSYFRYL